MPAGLKQLCGVALGATTLTTIYTATAEVAVSTIVVCNRGATATTFRLSHAPAGAADAMGQYFAYDVSIAANTMVPFTMGVCLANTDVLRAYAGDANLTVMVWGEEQALANGGVGTFLGLVDTPDAYTGMATRFVKVNAAELALEFVAQDPELAALAVLVSAADTLPYFTGLGTAALATFTAAGRTLVAGADAAAQRTTLGLGTLATQNAGAVAITDGAISIGGHAPTGVLDVQGSVVASDAANSYHSARIWPVAPAGAVGLTGVRVEATTGAGLATASFYGLYVAPQSATLLQAVGVRSDIAAGTNRFNIYANGTAPNYFAGPVGLGAGYNTPESNFRLSIDVARDTFGGIKFKHSGNDTGPLGPVTFANVANTVVGSIHTTATATTYNTSSDQRLKHAIATLAGALERVRALRPVAFRWNANDELGVGFLAHELQQVIPDAVTGEPDAVNDDGTVRPQQVDNSKVIPWVVGALQDVILRLEALEGGTP